ncbi:uncharacterized protein [Mytilus edulis]|uniref:uncharacterized protein isoform X2 n=1 Tax=Mytilus edulis TaxID=6550 RepID=UPI0039F14A0C
MILRLKSSWIFFMFWLMHIKDVCYALELQKYPDGLTAIDAQAMCGTSGLETDPSVLKILSKLYGHEFWTGLAKFSQLTPWMETIGCFLLKTKPSTENIVASVGWCQRECVSGYFSYNKEKNSCFCLNYNEELFSNAVNISSCLKPNAEPVYVYETYNETIKTAKAENGLCTTLTCTYPDIVDFEAAHCKGDDSIKGLCEDAMQSTSGTFYGIQRNQTAKYCLTKDKLLLKSNACKQFPNNKNLTSSAWTNVFREQITVEKTLGKATSLPKLCQSANISDKGEHNLNIHWQNCSIKLEWFVCKNGVIVGGSVGAVFVLLIGVIVTLCKMRRVGVFKNDTSEKTTNVIFTKTANDEDTSIEVKTQQHVNQGYGLVDQAKEKTNKTNDSYAQVQKVKRTEDTYAESTNGEYDHLHNIDGRKLNSVENAYDSNAGVRNRSDPTYDTAISSTRVDMDNTYDHSFTNLKTYSEYDVSDSRTQIGGTNYDAYDQAC